MRGSEDRLGIRIARTTLEKTLGCGHSWDGLRFRKLVVTQVHTLNQEERRLVNVLPGIDQAKQSWKE